MAAESIGITREGLRKRCRSLGLSIKRKTQGGLYRLPRIIMPKRGTDLSYLAAVIDCEGFIGTLKAHSPLAPYWAVGVANTDKPLIEWLEKIGGGVGVSKARLRRKEKYDWWLRARADVFVVLHAVEPFLRIKRERALSALNDYTRFFSRQLSVRPYRGAVVARMEELLAYERLA